MPKNETYILQNYFFEYIKAQSVGEKQAIIEDCKEEIPSSVLMIDRLKKAIDGLEEVKDTKIIFINKVFDITNNTINIELLENMESQIENKTVVMSPIKKEIYNITTYNNLEKQITNEEINTISQDDVIIDDKNYCLNEIHENDNKTMNYLIRKAFGCNQEELLFAENVIGKKYIISEKKLPEMCNQDIQKEESLCDKKSIWLFLENTLSQLDKNMQEDYLRIIFLDIITNQNFRILRNGTGVLDSDKNQNDYYILNGVTLKKEYVIESFFENYYDIISDISDLINDNYTEILDFIVDLIKNNPGIDEKYLINLRANIVKVYEKRNLKIGIQKITENYKEKYTDVRNINNDNFKANISNLKKSLGLKEQVLTKSGYASILTIVLGIITCGVFMAYLMLAK